MHLDEAQDAWERLVPEISGVLENIHTEQDTRFQIIDRILVEVLGWPRESIELERHSASGYADYLLKQGDRNQLVIEAKKSSKILIGTRNPKFSSYKIGGAALKSARDGIEQARAYCLDHGVIFAVLTSGLEWIAFYALRTDGRPPADGQALVFPTLESITTNFAVFFDLFAKEAVSQETFRIRLNEAEGLQVRHGDSLAPVIESTQIHLLGKSPLASDLDRIFSEFFSTMSGDNDPEMLAKCFVESRESHEADLALQKITQNLINQVEVVRPDRGEELARHLETAVVMRRGEFVLIIGNKGAGKSTFIDRFFKLVLDTNLRQRCLVVRIDLLDSNGDDNTIVPWLIETLRDQSEKELFQGTTPHYEELQGIFWKEYQQWSTGPHKILYESDRTAFKIRFGDYISELIEHKPEVYVKRLLQNSVRSRQLLPCIVFDNTDHFPQTFQERVFQFAQSIYRGGLSFVICPITDRTIWQLSKQGPLQSYVTTPFYLPVPSTKDVLNKRIQFIKEKLEDGKSNQNEYFVGKGIRLSIQNIRGFAAAIEEIFINTDYAGRIVGWLSNHDIRRGLQIAQRIITSPIITIGKLVTLYVTGKHWTVDERSIKRALIWGNYNGFQPSDSEFVVDVFTIPAMSATTPLAKLSILRLLIDRDNQTREQAESYMTIADIVNYLEPIGVARSVLFGCCAELLSFRLVEPYDPTNDAVYIDQRIRVTHSGRIHVEFAQDDEPYVTEMAKSTPIRDLNLVTKMRGLISGKARREDWISLVSNFMSYCLKEDAVYVTVPSADAYEGQRELRNRLYSRWVKE